MAGDLATMKARIADEVERSDLTPFIPNVIADAIAIYQKHRFRFSEGYNCSFLTNPGQEFYPTATLIAVTGTAAGATYGTQSSIRLTIAALASGNVNLNNVLDVTVAGIVGTTEANGIWTVVIVDATHIDILGPTFSNAYVSGGTVTTDAIAGHGNLLFLSGGVLSTIVLYQIDYLAIQIGTARFDLDRRQPEEIDLLTQSGTQKGQPHSYSYFNEQIRLYPVPSAAYPIIVGGHEIIPAPATDNEVGNRWMTDAERLIRCRAKYELSVNYGIDFPLLAQRMHPDTGATADAFSELKREVNKLTGTGRVRPSQF